MSVKPTIKLSDSLSVEIVDPDNITPNYVDFITELRLVDDVVYISFGSHIVDGDASKGHKVKVTDRLRLSRVRAEVLYGLLGTMLKPSEGASNEEPRSMN